MRELSGSASHFASFAIEGILLAAFVSCSTVSGMAIEPRLDIIGAALADPSRSRILCELMDGRAFTNKELASAAEISPQTTSAHLKQLELAGLTASLRSGRHIYHRVASADVARVLEGLATLSPTDHLYRRGRTATDTHRARSCYNHIAGRLGVLMTERLVALGVLSLRNEAMSSGPCYQDFLNDIGIETPHVSSGMPPARLCLDWTERRHHISGPLATAILQKSLTANWLERRTGSRALTVTADGFDALERWFGLNKATVNGPDRG
ncbi:MAG: winged helix-turn-helix transcriptional regulator [Silicimonas sp.]|nr:winged helix-turn-helix transcriptional regulator [Silicimonas sp.]